MTSEAPATALAAAIAATNFSHDDESGLAKFNLLAFTLLHQHGPALAAALKDAERLDNIERSIRDGSYASILADIVAVCQHAYATIGPGPALRSAIDAALSARVDDTPTRGTP